MKRFFFWMASWMFFSSGIMAGEAPFTLAVSRSLPGGESEFISLSVPESGAVTLSRNSSTLLPLLSEPPAVGSFKINIETKMLRATLAQFKNRIESRQAELAHYKKHVFQSWEKKGLPTPKIKPVPHGLRYSINGIPYDELNDKERQIFEVIFFKAWAQSTLKSK